MDKNQIISILSTWNFWAIDLNTGLKRPAYLNSLKKLQRTGQIIVITGPRRSGKSFLMKQLAWELIQNQGISKRQTLFINFEDPSWEELNVKLLNQIFNAYNEVISENNKPYVFLDEIQEVENWEKWVTSIHEQDRAHIVLSGSNAKLLSSDLATLLTGRHIDQVVHPLSFEEYLLFNGLNLNDKLTLATKESEIKRLTHKLIEFGSFPRVVLGEDSPKELLLGYFEDILNKDLIKRYKIRKPEGLRSLANYYLSNISSQITFSSIGKFLKLSTVTVGTFSHYLESSFLVYFLKRFSNKLREKEASPRKIYAIDTGLANAVGFRSSPNYGKLLENLVFLELYRKKVLSQGLELYYWKDDQHLEVDFVVKSGFNPTELIQVCWSLSDPKTKSREIKSTLKGMEALKQNCATIVTAEEDGKETIGDKEISIIPIWKWLAT